MGGVVCAAILGVCLLSLPQMALGVSFPLSELSQPVLSPSLESSPSFNIQLGCPTRGGPFLVPPAPTKWPPVPTPPCPAWRSRPLPEPRRGGLLVPGAASLWRPWPSAVGLEEGMVSPLQASGTLNLGKPGFSLNSHVNPSSFPEFRVASLWSLATLLSG